MARVRLGLTPHIAAGVRIPSIVIPPVLRAHRDSGSSCALMLSYHRETAPARVIREGLDYFRGHTGTSISEYISESERLSRLIGVSVQVEADHVSVMSSPERAIKRITGGGFEHGLSDSEVKASMDYIREEMEEARGAGGVDAITIDTCELVEPRADGMRVGDVLALYEESLDGNERRALERLYLTTPFRFLDEGGYLEIAYSKEDLARLVVKYASSIDMVVRVVRLCWDVLGRPTGLEVALDEIPVETSPKELFFYLNELRRRGVNVEFIAPNIGFHKREDYSGDLGLLEKRLRALHMVCRSMGSLISIHSGSGSHPYSDKGPGVWDVVRRSTSGLVKYKVSGVYIQLLLEVMSRMPRGSRARRLYEEIYDAVVDVVSSHVRSKSGLYSPALEDMLNDYLDVRSRRPGEAYNPRHPLFRHYFFVFQAVRDSRGSRYLRERLQEVYNEEDELRLGYEREAYNLTKRMIDRLGLGGNNRFLKQTA